MNENVYRQLWAKSEPYHELWRHLLDVAAVSQALWPRFGPIEEMPPLWASYLCALHDIGKADPWFQNKNSHLADQLMELDLKLPICRDTTPEDMRWFRHEARSSDWLKQHLAQHDWDKAATRVVTKAITGHHGNFGASCYAESGANKGWQSLRARLAQLVWDTLQPPPYAPRAFAHASAVGVEMAGLIILADWIASNADIYHYQTLHQHQTAADYFAAAQQMAGAVIGKLKFDAPSAMHRSEPLRFAQVWPERAETPRPMQSALEQLILQRQIAPGLAIIEEQMGWGKTEAAIYLAESWNAQRGTQGIYIGLPTQATSNQMFTRYGKYLQHWRPDDEARLVHGMAWLYDDEAPADVAQTYGGSQNGGAQKDERLLSREWFRPLRRALLARDGVGTIDQALLAALHVKFGVLRLLGLRSKVLIVDEAHAYDEYMTTILEQLLKWCRALEIPVILLSATLAAHQKQRLVAAYGGDANAIAAGGEVAYPLLTLAALKGDTRTVSVMSDEQRRVLGLELHHGFLDDATKIARLALQQITDGGCACVLMNTVKGAQQVYEAIEQLLKVGEFVRPGALQLFHARFRAQARRDIENRVVGWFGNEATVENGQRPRRAILVATQVVEQSLDVDFDFFISQIAPLDLLLQRSGRLWRHPRARYSAQPTLQVLAGKQGTLAFGPSEKVYVREILLRTLVALQRCAVDENLLIELPRDFRTVIEEVYGAEISASDSVPRAEIEAAAQAHQAQQDQARSKANVNLLPDPDARAFDWVGRDKSEADEGAAANYLRISTRMGDESRAALVLENRTFIEIAQSSQKENARAPKREQMQQLFAHKVNLPVWWLRETAAATGYEAIFEGANWLRGHIVVPMRAGQWRSQNGAIMHDNETLGLTFVPANQNEEKGKADAGQIK